MACNHVTAVRLGVEVAVHPSTPAKNGIDRRNVCLDCLGFVCAAGIKVHPLDGQRLAAAAMEGRDGGAAGLHLPTLDELFKHGALPTVATAAGRRIDTDPQALNDRYLIGLMRNAMNFSKTRRGWRANYPHAYSSPAIDHPIIVHPGFLDKVLDQRRDVAHLRFCSYIPEALATPSEVYRDSDAGRDIYRIISALTVDGTAAHFLHIVVDAESHVMDTAYVPQANRHGADRIEEYRTGMLVHLGWKILPI